MSELVCPKCQSPMRSYERSGITVDQCSGCRGVFLDRGELERLVDAEGAYYEGRAAGAPEPPASAVPPASAEPPRERPRDYGDRERRDYDDRDRDRDYDDRRPRRDDYDDRRRDDDNPLSALGGLGGFGGGGHRGHGKRKKRESFLSELFD